MPATARTPISAEKTAVAAQCLQAERLKEKHENFFVSDFEFLAVLWLVMPNYYVLEIMFSLDQYRYWGSYDPCKLGEKNFPKNSNMAL